MSENETKVSEEDQIKKDIAAAKASMVSKETAELIKQEKESARAEAEKEFAVNQKVKELEEQNKKLQEEHLQKEKEAAQRLEDFQKRLDELTTSKAPLRSKDPFVNEPSPDGAMDVKNWDDQKINDIERASGKAFFGEEFDRPL
jgi:uncharacterized protein (DUF3084 family)